MARWSDSVLDDDVELIPAQAPIRQPDPIRQPLPVQQPMEARRPIVSPATPAAPAPRQADPTAPRRWSDEAATPDMGRPEQFPAQPATSSQGPFPGYKDPKTEGWGEWIGNNVTGRKDPRYQGVQSFEKAMLAENNEGALTGNRAAAPFVTTDTGMANIAQQSLRERFIRQEQDAYGAPVVVYRGRDGKEAKAYVNQPGLDGEDVGRGIAQAVPYLMTGGPVGALVKGVGGRVVAGGVAAGATSLAGDTAGMLMGSNETPDLEKASTVAAVAGGTALAAPVVSGLWRKFVTEPGLFNSTTGQLTPKGAAAAQQAGLDPAALTRELAQDFTAEFARTGSTQLGAGVAQRKAFDLPSTRGQLTKDPQALLTEKGMRYGVYGEGSKDIIQGFDRRQAEAIRNAAIGDSTAKLSVAETIAPGRSANAGPAILGADLKAGVQEAAKVAKSAEKEAWAKVGPLHATDAAKAELPAAITAKVGSLPVDETLTPRAASMVKDLETFIKGGAPGVESSVLQRAPVQDVGDMRKRLLTIYKGAADNTDKAAAKAIYDGFNDWIDASAQKAFLSGNPASAAAMRQARDITKEMKSVFGERGTDGMRTPGRNVIQNLLDDGATPETIISKLFTTDAGAPPKVGTVEALKLMKDGFGKYLPPDKATAVWNDVGLAAWQRLVMKPSGDLHTPTMLHQNIDKFLRSQATVAQTLYTPDTIKLIRQFGSAMKEVAYKDPNPSGSGTAAALYAGQFGQALMRVLGAAEGPLAKVASAIMGWSGVKNAIGTVAASSATRVSVPTAVPNLAPYAGAAAAQTGAPRNRLAR